MNTTETLSSGQVTEMKKVFAMFNQSGSSCLNVEELSIALERISGSKPSLEEVQELMSAFDKDKDGRVSWDEFYVTLSSFIRDKERQCGSHKTDFDIFDKKRLHSNIADFFLSHKKCDNWEHLRQRRLQIASSIQSSVAEVTPQDIMDQNKKREQLGKCKGMCTKMPEVVSSLHHSIGANDIKKTTECVQYLADILSIVNIYKTEQDRLSIAEFLATLFRRIRDSAVAKVIIGFLCEAEAPSLQYQSARFISHYCQGPRIPNTPCASTLHPSNMHHKSVCINNGAVSYLEVLFDTRQDKLRNKAIEAVGKIASHDAKARQYVIAHGIPAKLLALIGPRTSIQTLRYVTWTLSIILGNTHCTHLMTSQSSDEPLLFQPQLLQNILSKLGKLLFESVATLRKDFEADQNNTIRKGMLSVLMNTLCSLSYLICGISNLSIFWRKFIELIAFPVAEIQCMVLDCMKDIIEVDANHLEEMLNIGLLKVLRNPLSSKHVGARHKALSLLSCIVRSSGGKYVAAVMSSQLGYIHSLVELMNNDDLCRLTIVKIFRFITVNQHCAKQLVQQNAIIHHLGCALNGFKKFDPIIREVYHYVGPSYNFEFVHDIIETLNNILECGRGRDIDKFDMQLLDRISDVIMKISSAKGIQSWRNVSNSDSTNNNISLENRLVRLLENIKFTHLRCNTKLSNEVKNFVDELIFNFRKNVEKNQYKEWRVATQWEWIGGADHSKHGSWSEYMIQQNTNRIRIKCEVRNKNGTHTQHTIENVDKNVSIGNLHYRLSALCCSGDPVRIYYHSGTREVFIRSQNDLNDAVYAASFNELHLVLVPLPSDNRNNSNNNDNDNIHNFARNFGLPTNMIHTLWCSFRKKAKDGTINKQSFTDIMKECVGMNDYTQSEQLFNAFDYNKNGLLDFREICVGFAVLHTGSADDKIKLAFSSFDIDDNGKLAPAELFLMFKSITTIKDIRHNTKDIEAWTKDCFNKYDTGNKGHLVFDEFKQMVHRRPLLIQTFFQFNK
eukprot:68893_1